jgi:hypothetical protein
LDAVPDADISLMEIDLDNEDVEDRLHMLLRVDTTCPSDSTLKSVPSPAPVAPIDEPVDYTGTVWETFTSTPDSSCVLIDAADMDAECSNINLNVILAELRAELRAAVAETVESKSKLANADRKVLGFEAELNEIRLANEKINWTGDELGHSLQEARGQLEEAESAAAALRRQLVQSTLERDSAHASVASLEAAYAKELECSKAEQELFVAKLLASEDAYRLSEEVVLGMKNHLNDARLVINGLRLKFDEAEAEAEAERSNYAYQKALDKAKVEASNADNARLLELRCELAAAESEKKSAVSKLTTQLEQAKAVCDSLKEEVELLKAKMSSGQSERLASREEQGATISPTGGHPGTRDASRIETQERGHVGWDGERDRERVREVDRQRDRDGGQHALECLENEAKVTKLALDATRAELDRSRRECLTATDRSNEILITMSLLKTALEAAEKRERESCSQRSSLQDYVLKVIRVTGILLSR